MSYVLPKALSNQFSTSLQTIYNYLKKSWNKIRTKREGGKTYIHQEDFKAVFKANFKSFEYPLENNSEDQSETNFKNLKDGFKSIESEKSSLSKENQNLNRYNLALQDQVSKYALLLTDEKEEKKQLISNFESKEKEWSWKIDASQKELREKIENFGKERIKWAKRYYITVGICCVLVLVAIGFAYPRIITYFG